MLLHVIDPRDEGFPLLVVMDIGGDPGIDMKVRLWFK